jgi:hypothetical protein
MELRAGPDLFDNLNQHPLSVLGPARFHDRPQRLRRPALSADHLATLLLGDAQLKQDRVLVLFVFADLDLVRVVDQSPGEELKQLLQPSSSFSRCPLPSGGA